MPDGLMAWLGEEWQWATMAVLGLAGLVVALLQWRKREQGGDSVRGGKGNIGAIVQGDAKAQSGTGPAIAGPVAGSVNIHQDVSVKEFERVVTEKVIAETERDGLRQKIEKVSKDKEAAEELLSEFERSAQLGGVPRSEQPEKVREMAEAYLKLQEELAARQPEGGEAALLRNQGREALEKGGFEEAERMFIAAAEEDAQAAGETKERVDELFLSAAAGFAEAARVKEIRLAYADAAAYYQRAADTVPEGEDEKRAEYLNSSGRNWWRARRYGEAEKAFGEALEIRRRTCGPEDADLAESLHGLGTVLSNERRFKEARANLDEALGIYRGLAEAEPHIYEPDVAMTLNNLGNVQRNERDFPGARKSYDEALRIYRGLAKAEPHIYEPYVATTLNNLGTVQSDERDFPGARKSFEKALRICRRLAEAEPHIYEPDVAMTLNNLGNVQRNERDFPGARRSYGEALRIRRRLAETEPHIYEPYVATTLNNLGLLLEDIGDIKSAEADFAEAVTLFTKHLGEEHPWTKTARESLLRVRGELGGQAGREEETD